MIINNRNRDVSFGIMLNTNNLRVRKPQAQMFERMAGKLEAPGIIDLWQIEEKGRLSKIQTNVQTKMYGVALKLDIPHEVPKGSTESVFHHSKNALRRTLSMLKKLSEQERSEPIE